MSTLFIITNENIKQDCNGADYAIEFKQYRRGIAELCIQRKYSSSTHGKLYLDASNCEGANLNYILNAQAEYNGGKFCYTVTIKNDANKPVNMNVAEFALVGFFVEYKNFD